MMPKPDPKETWRELVDEAGEAEIEKAAQVSVAQAEKELAAAGFDVAAERAKGEAFLADIEAGRPVSGLTATAAPPKPPGVAEVIPMAHAKTAGAAAPSRPRMNRMWWLAAAAAAAVVVGAIAIPTANVVVSASPKEHADALRREATAACKARRYAECEKQLDEARALDPDGEQAADVKAQRELLQRAPRER